MRYLLESRKLMVEGEEGKVALGWELTFYNDTLGVVEKTIAYEDDTIKNAEPEKTEEEVKQDAVQPFI